jgi:hypothetical protein
MTAYALIFACSIFLTCAFVFGWGVGGFLFSSNRFERLSDCLVASTSLLLLLVLYQAIASEALR